MTCVETEQFVTVQVQEQAGAPAYIQRTLGQTFVQTVTTVGFWRAITSATSLKYQVTNWEARCWVKVKSRFNAKSDTYFINAGIPWEIKFQLLMRILRLAVLTLRFVMLFKRAGSPLVTAPIIVLQSWIKTHEQVALSLIKDKLPSQVTWQVVKELTQLFQSTINCWVKVDNWSNSWSIRAMSWGGVMRTLYKVLYKIRILFALVINCSIIVLFPIPV